MKLLKLVFVVIITVTLLFSGCSELKELKERTIQKINNSLENLPKSTPTVKSEQPGIPTPHPTPNSTPKIDETAISQFPTSMGDTRVNISETSESSVEITELLTNSTTLVTPEFCKNEINWRYNLEKAIYCTLNQKELIGISELALKLKGKDIKESAWNILEWENNTIDYDWNKASLPPPKLVYWSDGRIEVVEGKENVIQTPTETIQRGKGICSDYTILTAALLLEMGYQPVYILDIRFENYPIGHVTAAIKVGGEFFALDQHPPLLDLGSYYKKWAEDQGTFSNKKIQNITVYRVGVKGSEIEVENLGNLTADEIKQLDYTLSKEDLKAIESTLVVLFERRFHDLREDVNLKDLDVKGYLPIGYKKGGFWRFQFPHFAEYYNPVFHYQFTEFLFKRMLNTETFNDLANSNRFWIEVRKGDGDLTVMLYFANKII